MSPILNHLVAFCQTHGTPKLQAARRSAIIGHLRWAGCVDGLVWVRRAGVTVGLGVAWPVDESRVPGSGFRVKQAAEAPVAPARTLGTLDPEPGTGRWDPYAAHEPASLTVYVANLVALDRAALREILRVARIRWPRTERWLGHRVPKCRRLDPEAKGELETYPDRARVRLAGISGRTPRHEHV
jgi:hypothetical protein